MFIVIPTGRRYTARVQSDYVRNCTCEQCGNAFAYRFKVTGTGTGSSPFWTRNQAAGEDARKSATRAMEKTAKKAYPPFPCPSCRHFQAIMVQYYKRTRLPRLFKVSAFMLLLVFVVATIAVFLDGFESVLTSGPFWFGLSLPGCLIALVLIVRALAKPKAVDVRPAAT